MTTSHSLVTKAARTLLAIFLIAAPLLFSTATVEGFEDLKVAALTVTALIFVALGLVSINQAKLRSFAALRQPLVVGVLLFAVSATVSTFLSISPRTSWRGAYESHGGLITILGYIVLFFAARRLGGGRRLLAGVVLAATVASAYALVQAAGHDPVAWDGISVFGNQVRPFATIGHANLLGAYLALSLPLVTYFIYRSAQRRRWALVGVLAMAGVAGGLALVLTLSRAAWLGAGCAGLVLLGGWWCGRARRAVAITLLLALLSGGVAVTAYERQWLPGPFQAALGERLHHLDDGIGRPEIWRAGLEIYRDHWATGSGLDTFRLAFGTKRTAAFWDKEGDGTPTKAHNEAIHILATQGTLGGVALLVLVIGLAWAMVQAWRRSADRVLVAALTGTCVAFGVTNLFGFTAIPTGSLFAVCAGLLSRLAGPPSLEQPLASTNGGWRLWASPCLACATLVLAYVGVIEPLLANMACRNGDLATGDAAVACYLRATKLDPGCDFYWGRLAEAARREALQTGSEEDAALVRPALERTTKLVAVDAYHHANLGRFLGQMLAFEPSLGQVAVAEWQRAVALDPNNPYILEEAARTALVIKDYSVAQNYAGRGAELYPKWGVFYAWFGAAALGQGDLHTAQQGLKEALKTEKDWHNDGEGYGQALLLLAQADMRLQEYGQAEAVAAEASKWLPKWPRPHQLRGSALFALGRQSEAARELMTANTLKGTPVTSASPR
jgi:O-antigen ligase/tetratricopeptide (TPR) repeat protein